VPQVSLPEALSGETVCLARSYMLGGEKQCQFTTLSAKNVARYPRYLSAVRIVKTLAVLTAAEQSAAKHRLAPPGTPAGGAKGLKINQ